MCKGSSAAGGEGLFFPTLSPLCGPPPLTQGRRIQTRLGDACKRASHTRKSLLEKAYLKICISSPITEVSFALSSKQKTEMRNHLCFLIIKFVQYNYQSFFCLLFFSKKSRSKKSRSVFFICVCEAAFGGFAIAGIHILACAIHSFYDVIKRDLA